MSTIRGLAQRQHPLGAGGQVVQRSEDETQVDGVVLLGEGPRVPDGRGDPRQGGR
ncbi:MAG TPA: hypothetical protein VFR87_18820 [Nocardioidaceae bacterium]|nr:hypothetical protein [Nocardioidaceae bacterium]